MKIDMKGKGVQKHISIRAKSRSVKHSLWSDIIHSWANLQRANKRSIFRRPSRSNRKNTAPTHASFRSRDPEN